jgi:ABC-type multidrug transport system fused ATPase/permease subunit
VNLFFDPVRQLTQEYNQLQRTTVAAERIFEILDTKQEIIDAPDAKPLPTIEGRVTYDHVKFSYVPGVEVLHDFDLDIAPGERIAFVGQTGAGKSTIINLLMRFYDVTGGAIRIDGHDIRDVTMDSLRRQVGIVLQEPVLFTGTITDNIRYARPEATDEEVRRAAAAVGAEEIIERLPKGYNTEVQERGVGLSLGERQLIAFARALLADPRILILDEATANLDTTTEAIVQRGIRGLIHGRTSLIIAHRLSTVRDADRIIVLEHGRIIEEGNHEALLALHGVYHRLYTMGFEQMSPAGGTNGHREAVSGQQSALNS